jgi:site-specific DNA-methyltransferase (cytosine-N4-specific)
MKTARLLWNAYKYFPYERDFANREVAKLLGRTPKHVSGGLEAEDTADDALLSFQRLTYFSEIVLADGRVVIPDQARLEASVVGNSTRAIEGASRKVARQSTRYSAHGIHEYRGKFNPQIVRAIGNMLDLPTDAWVLDPFCGSGTTLLECAHIGWNGIGIELNPLGELIANAKLEAFHTPSSTLQKAVGELTAELVRKTKGLDYDAEWTDGDIVALAGPGWRQKISNLAYVQKWFSEAVLAQFVVVLDSIETLRYEQLRPVFKVILSDLVRIVSMQDPGDLRIRRRKDPKDNWPLVPMFIKSTSSKIENIIRAQGAVPRKAGYQKAFLVDSRGGLEWAQDVLRQNGKERFDAAITSPPYATALPYADTHRLSLTLFGLIESGDVMRLDRGLIGTREIVDKERHKIEELIRDPRGSDLPGSVLDLCQQMLRLASRPENGFRRRNMPALTYQYFTDMARVFRRVRSVIRRGGCFALVVGRNRSLLGGKSVLIDTPKLLLDVAFSTGWRPSMRIELNTYQRFDVHQRNSIRNECLIVARSP